MKIKNSLSLKFDAFKTNLSDTFDNIKRGNFKAVFLNINSPAFGIILFIVTNIVSSVYSPWDMGPDSIVGSFVFQFVYGGIADVMSLNNYVLLSPVYGADDVKLLYTAVIGAIFAYIWLSNRIIKRVSNNDEDGKFSMNTFAFSNLAMYITCLLSYHVAIPLTTKMINYMNDTNLLSCIIIAILFGILIILPSLISTFRIDIYIKVIFFLIGFFEAITGDNLLIFLITFILLLVLVYVLDNVFDVLLDGILISRISFVLIPLFLLISVLMGIVSFLMLRY